MSVGGAGVRCFILGLLARRPMSGYDIKRSFKNLGWLVSGPSFGSLYPTLRTLLQDSLVTVSSVPRQDGQPRKIYSITEAGERALRDWFKRPTTPDASLKTFVMRLILASNFSQTGLVSHLHQRSLQVSVHRDALEQSMAALDETADLGERLTLEYALAMARAELAWLDDVLDRLSRESLPVEVVQGDSAASAT